MATATPPKTPTDPTEPLSNKNQEAFAQMVASGLAYHKAYAAAGFKAKNTTTATSLSCRMLSNDIVNARVSHLRKGYDQVFAVEITRKAIGNITDRVERIKGYGLQLQLLLELMAERAADPLNQDVPGIRTGNVVVSMKFDKDGNVIQREAKADMAVQDMILKVKKQAAIELRQWVEQQGGPPPIDPREMTPEQLDLWMNYFAGLDPTGYKAAVATLGLPEPVGEVIESKGDKSEPVKVDPFA